VASALYSPGNLDGAALVVAIVTSGKGPLALDAGRAAQNMMLAAHNDGIGSCPNGLGDPAAAAAALGLEEGEQVATILTFGYPRRKPRERSPDDWIARADRLPFDDVVSER
jgi:nitroreductase